jgi:dTDP-4-amino-4,6-dideoxy-D-galactose acyltransferase
MARERVEGLYFLADAADADTARLAAEAGFRLVDVRVTLEGPVAIGLPRQPRRPAPAADPGRVRPAVAADLPELRRIATASHHDSRFYYDPHFDDARCDELYATWIETSCADPAGTVLVAAAPRGASAGTATATVATPAPGRVCGYITATVAPGGEGRIGLVAVDAAAHGRGIGGELIAAAFDWFAGNGVGTVSVVTQGRNVRAQRLYQRFGMLTRSLELWYHLWVEPPAGDGTRPGGPGR